MPNTTNESPQLIAKLASIEDILCNFTLLIPEYQRPYSWTVESATQLVEDIRRFQPGGHYRIGTFIMHVRDAGTSHGDSSFDIVDGQQRFLTFALIAHALRQHASDLGDQLGALVLKATTRIRIPNRNDGRSAPHLRRNAGHITKLIARWTTAELRCFAEFFFKECSVVWIVVKDLDAAFQMFDSQNTRGRPLFPTDLLKAYHLRELRRTSTSAEMLEIVRRWEALPPAEIDHVIAAVLFPIKTWTAGRSLPRRGFSAADVHFFKGIQEGPHGNGKYRWAHAPLMVKETVDRLSRDSQVLQRHGVIPEITYPFQITQPIIDGEMFFEMVQHYVGEARKAGIDWSLQRNRTVEPRDSDPALYSILDVLSQQTNGAGDRYVRSLFECLLVAYVDRYGWYEVEAASRILAQHAYLVRVALRSVYLPSVDKHALAGHPSLEWSLPVNLFTEIALALTPDVILQRPDVTLPAGKDVPARLTALYVAPTPDKGAE